VHSIDMADPSDLTIKDKQGKVETIYGKDLVAAIPDTDGNTWTYIHVESNEADASKPPTVKFLKGYTADSQRKDPTPVDETHVIISTGSGGKLAKQFFDQAVTPVLQALFPSSYSDIHIHTTESESSILDLAKDVFFPKADADKSLRIILLSGDGGVVDLVNGLLAKPASANYKPPQVVLIPLGTANALYHSINPSKDNTWGLSALAKESYHPLPVFTTTFSPGARLLVDEARKEEELPTDPENGHQILHGAVVCSWGMHASLVADSDTTEYRKFGIDRFKMAAKEALYPADGSPPHPYKAEISLLKGSEWKKVEGDEHMYVLATPLSNLEKTFTISPASKPLTGDLRFVHFGPTNGDEAMRIMGLAYQGGKHVDDPLVHYEAIDGLRINLGGREENGRWRRICIDGKIVRLEKDGWVELRKESRRVLDVASI
jgi:diacylglycerol kinase family enzyme